MPRAKTCIFSSTLANLYLSNLTSIVVQVITFQKYLHSTTSEIYIPHQRKTLYDDIMFCNGINPLSDVAKGKDLNLVLSSDRGVAYASQFPSYTICNHEMDTVSSDIHYLFLLKTTCTWSLLFIYFDFWYCKATTYTCI